MADFLHTMVRITDPEKSRAFYEALGFRFNRDMDIVRDGELEATNYFYSIGDAENVLELTFNHDGRTYELGTAYGHIAIGVDDLDGTLGAALRPGHRARAPAVPGGRGRLADLLRPRPGRLPHRAHRAALVAQRCRLERELDGLAAETSFSGVIRVDRGDRIEVAKAYGLAHRGLEIPNDINTRFAIASGTKGLTALAVVSLVEDGSIELSTPARSVLGGDLPLIDDGVTVEQLLAHRSGIGDYLDEDAGDFELSDYLMPVPVHELATTEDYLAVLDGHPTKFAPGERFAYCNSGYVVLALIAERVSGRPFHDVVRERVCDRRECTTRSSCAPTSCPEVPPSATSKSRACGGATCSTCRCVAAATEASTRPSRTRARSGRRSSPAGSCLRSGCERWCVRGAWPPTPGATGLASGFTPRRTP